MSTPVLEVSIPRPFTPNRQPPSSANVDSLTIKRPDDVQINDIIDRVRRRYPREQISSSDLRERVCGFYSEFDSARVRNFVVILVERMVRRSIEAPSER